MIMVSWWRIDSDQHRQRKYETYRYRSHIMHTTCKQQSNWNCISNLFSFAQN